MNKLNTFLSFVLLSFCLLINVSYAEIIEANVSYSLCDYTTSYPSSVGSYNNTTANRIVNNYVSDSVTYESDFIALCEDVFSTYGYDSYFLYKSVSADGTVKSSGHMIFFFNSDDEVGIDTTTKYNNTIYYMGINLSESDTLFEFQTDNTTGSRCLYTITKSGFKVYGIYYFVDIFANHSVKEVIINRSPYSMIWDGASYYYEAPATPDEPSTPSMPTNAEIANAVQLFYNSVYQLPNIAFDDFFVLYDTSTKNYLYIGHTRGNALGQVIVEPNGYYDGFKFDVQWWQFFLDEQEDAWNWQNINKYNNYFLYTSKGSADTLKNAGQGKISELLSSGPWATSTTIIVYSTTDYPVKYITFTEDSPDPTVQTGIIEGDQYTYDENLEITDNNYNPLDSFVTIDYPSTLVSRADFEGFMSIFNENKEYVILPSNANWIILANNSLFNHFSSFIVMCTIFIIIERFMRG